MLLTHPDFIKKIEDNYKTRIKDLGQEVGNFLSLNTEIHDLLMRGHISADSVVSKISHDFFATIIDSTIEDFYKSVESQSNIIIHFTHNNYINYLLSSYAGNDQDSSILGVKFLKKLNTQKLTQENIAVEYNLSFNPNLLLTGYISYPQTHEAKTIQRCYYEILCEQNMDKQFTKNLTLAENDFVKKFLNNIIERQAMTLTQGIHYHFEDFKCILSHADKVLIDGNTFSSQKAIEHCEKTILSVQPKNLTLKS